jgi:hypothetical protein
VHGPRPGIGALNCACVHQQTKEITVDEMSKVTLSNKLTGLQARVAKVRFQSLLDSTP